MDADYIRALAAVRRVQANVSAAGASDVVRWIA